MRTWLVALFLVLAACGGPALRPDADSGMNPRIRVLGSDTRPWDVLYLGGGYLVAVLHGDNALGLWSLAGGPARRFPEVGYHPDAVAPWDAGRFVVAAEGVGEVQLWRLEGGVLVKEKAVSAGFPVRDVLAADLDGDGRRDLVLSPYAGRRVRILWGAGDFRFPESLDLAAAPTPWHPALIDWNHDDLPDLVWSDWDAGSVRVQVNRGGRRFDTVFLQPPSPGSPRQVGVGDVDGDGWDDVVAALETGKAARVFYHRGGERVATEDIPAPRWGYSSAAVTVDGTVILGEEGRVILAHRTAGRWILRRLPAGSLPSRLRLADVNGDGVTDLLVANSAGGGVTLIHGPLWDLAEPLETP